MVELFTNEYNNAPKTFENALMVWRGMIILMQFEHFFEWDWNSSLINVLKIMNTVHKDLRALKPSKTDLLIDYISKTVDR